MKMICVFISVLLFVSANHIAKAEGGAAGNDDNFQKLTMDLLLDHVNQLYSRIEAQDQIISGLQDGMQKQQVLNEEYKEEIESQKSIIQDLQNKLGNNQMAVQTKMENFQLELNSFQDDFTKKVLNVSEFIGFSAFATEDMGYGPGATIKFESVEYSSGTGYNPEASIFYCTVPGVYYFSVSLMVKLDPSNNHRSSVTLSKGGGRLAHLYTTTDSVTTSKHHMVSKSVITNCSEGDLVYVEAYETTTVDGSSPWSSFMGFLINTS